jgi:hypothetical protein
MRGRGHRGGGGGGVRHQGAGGGIPLNRNHVFDSSGPDIRLRGTAQQLFEKYLQLGRDASGGGDRVMAESYFQHAEHYFRILNAMNQAAQQNQSQGGFQQRRHGQGDGGGENGPGDSMAAEGSEGEDAEIRNGGESGPAEVREIPIAAAPPEV